MNPIEKAIRNALEKGDAADRAFREKVYRSVHAAVERTIEANPAMPADSAAQRRTLLKDSIRAVESEFQPASEPDLPPPVRADTGHAAAQSSVAPAVTGASRASSTAGNASMAAPPVAAPDPARPAAPALRGAGPAPASGVPAVDAPVRHGADRAPRIETPRAPAKAPPRAEPHLRAAEPIGPVRDADPAFMDDVPPLDLGVGAGRTMAPEGRRRRRRSRVYANVFIAATLVAAVLMGAWWAWQQGLFLTAEQRDRSVPNPSPIAEEESFDPNARAPLSGEAADAAANWIIVFDPTDASQVVMPEGVEAELVDAEGTQALRIRSTADDEPVIFDVGAGILEQVAGKRALFDIEARAEDGTSTQIFVTCNFGELGDCGRNRYNLASERTDYLFDLDMPAKSPGSAGSIAIAPAGTVEIFSIRVSVPGA